MANGVPATSKEADEEKTFPAYIQFPENSGAHLRKTVLPDPWYVLICNAKESKSASCTAARP